MLTLFYVSATLLQSWRINKICKKISEQLIQKSSIAFYTLPSKLDDGFDIFFATSVLCTNRKVAKVSEILWLMNNQRGCCLTPIQMVNVSSWVTFGEAPSFLPFAYSETPRQLIEHLKHSQNKVFLLLETNIEPLYAGTQNNTCDIIKVEKYGKLVAWKVHSNLAMIIETDVEYFTKLLIASFLQSNFLINDKLSLIRIESVYKESAAQPLDLLLNHIKKPSRETIQTTKAEWEEQVKVLKALNLLASQAIEYECIKNRTEANTGAINPNLMFQGKKKERNRVSNLVENRMDLGIDKYLIKKQDKEDGHNENKSQYSYGKFTVNSKKKEVENNDAENKVSHLLSLEPNNTISVSLWESLYIKDETEEKMSFASEKLQNLDFSKGNKDFKTFKNIVQKSDIESTNLNFRIEVCHSEDIESPSKCKTIQDKFLESNKRPNKPSLSNVKANELTFVTNNITESKPLNILVYSDSRSARDNAVNTIRNIVEPNMFTIYPITSQQVEEKYWIENTALLVVCGYVVSNIGEILVDYFLHGGKVLSICSDILNFILPSYRTAEVRQDELVQFSYGRWKNIKMMHHIFCYQPYPVKKHFSTESEEYIFSNQTTSGIVCPKFIELKDQLGTSHNIDVEILGTEETWNTPSMLLAVNSKTGGKAVFSQIHLESSPSLLEMDDLKFEILKNNETVRLEIFADLLSKYFNININTKFNEIAEPLYKNAYLLGTHQAKSHLLEKMRNKMQSNNLITTSRMKFYFCQEVHSAPNPKENFLPIYIHSCPDDFSTVSYFDNLKTKYIGRLLVYTPIVTSTMNVVSELDLVNGIAVVARQQTEGVGRSSNQWLSPLGCVMFSLQLHLSLDSVIGSKLSLIQHIIGLAIVNALKSNEIYKVLDIALKWPNDIYANSVVKIGGLIVQTTVLGDNAIVNIGCGVNLDNKKPTICINGLISEYNKNNLAILPMLNYEEFIALMFNEIERLIEEVQKGNLDMFYNLYYDNWLHNDKTVLIQDDNGRRKEATVVGINNYGYLNVKMKCGTIETVQPDGNTFDILKGLIIPKYF